MCTTPASFQQLQMLVKVLGPGILAGLRPATDMNGRRCNADTAPLVLGSGTGIGIARGIAGTETGPEETTGKGVTGTGGIGIDTGTHQGGMATGNLLFFSILEAHDVDMC